MRRKKAEKGSPGQAPESNPDQGRRSDALRGPRDDMDGPTESQSNRPDQSPDGERTTGTDRHRNNQPTDHGEHLERQQDQRTNKADERNKQRTTTNRQKNPNKPSRARFRNTNKKTVNMGVRKIELSDREKAAIYMHVYGGVTDWQRLFFTAYAGTYEDAAAKNNLVVVVSRWKNLERVQNFLRQVLEEKARADVKIQDAARDEGRKEAAEQAAKEEEKKTGKPANIGRDYMDPENQKRKLNEIVNRAQTTGEALDALKIIMSTQKDDRQAARDLSQVRVFLPLRCENCPLYDAARRKIQAAEG